MSGTCTTRIRRPESGWNRGRISNTGGSTRPCGSGGMGGSWRSIERHGKTPSLWGLGTLRRLRVSAGDELDVLRGCGSGRVLVNDGHEGAGHPGGILVLDDIATVNDAG